MAGWLPEGFQVDARRLERSVSAVSGRIVRRKSRVRLAKRVAGAALVLALVALSPVILNTLRSPSTPEGPIGPLTPPAALHAAATKDAPAVTLRTPPPPVTLSALRSGTPEGSRSQAPRSLKRAPAKPPQDDRPPSDLPVTLAKVDHSVAVRWQGPKDEEYEVYRCNTPTFETCSLAGTVQGTSWTEPGLDAPANSATIVYYKVVPRSGA